MGRIRALEAQLPKEMESSKILSHLERPFRARAGFELVKLITEGKARGIELDDNSRDGGINLSLKDILPFLTIPSPLLKLYQAQERENHEGTKIWLFSGDDLNAFISQPDQRVAALVDFVLKKYPSGTQLVHLKRDSLYQQAAMDYSLELLRQCKALNDSRSQKERELPELAILNRLTDEVISLYASEMDVKL